MKITIDTDGFANGFYSDDALAPTGAISVTAEQFSVLLEYQDRSKKYNVSKKDIDTISKTETEILQASKDKAKAIIKVGFENELTTRTFLSVIAGQTVDNRRSGTKFDRDNLDALIDLASYPFTFVCVDGAFEVADATTANDLKLEMIEDGLLIYQSKFSLEAEVLAITNDILTTDAEKIALYDAIVW